MFVVETSTGFSESPFCFIIDTLVALRPPSLARLHRGGVVHSVAGSRLIKCG